MPLPQGVAARHVMMLLMMLARLFQQANRNCMPCLLVYMQKDMEVVAAFRLCVALQHDSRAHCNC